MEKVALRRFYVIQSKLKLQLDAICLLSAIYFCFLTASADGMWNKVKGIDM